MEFPVEFNASVTEIVEAEQNGSLYLLGNPGFFELDLLTKKVNVFDELKNFQISAINKSNNEEKYWLSTKYDGFCLLYTSPSPRD